MDLVQQDKDYLAGTYARFDLQAISGRGAVCTDVAGKQYIDFSSGIGVNSLGFCDAAWVQAVCAQAGKLQHISNLYYTEPGVVLAKALCERTFAKKVFLCNSGAEANEGMIKAARKYSSDKYGEGRHTILTLENSFHGRTVTTLAATGQEGFHQHFGPFTEGFDYVKANDIADMTAKLSQSGVCAFLIEPIQGEGGVVPLDEAFVRKAAQLCAERDILLLVDEVQTGVGRTGSFLCIEQFGVIPDIVSLAKGLGSGLPIGAVLLGEKCTQTLGAGQHGTTFGGNPIACAGACEVIRRLDEDMLKQVREKGAYIAEKLQNLPRVKDVTGRGLMLGITLEGIDSKTAAARCLENGLIALTAKEKLRFLPPLVITYDEINEGLKRLSEVLSQ